MSKTPKSALQAVDLPSLSHCFAPISRQLEAVEHALQQAMVTGIDSVDQVLAAVTTQGKRLRPALLLLFASMGSVGPPAVDLAVGVELLHWATLVHDDIVDASSRRRGMPSLNARWGNAVAVLVGDYLFARAYDYLTTGGPAVCRLADGLIRAMAEGEIMQLRSTFDPSYGEAHYYECIERKTARFMAACCRLGATVSQDDALPGACAHQFGLALGMAFQIADDLTDFSSGAPDLRQGVLTLPAIRLLQLPEGRRFMAPIQSGRLDGRTCRSLVAAAVKHGAIDYARQAARRFAGLAGRALEGMPPGAIRDSLRRICEIVVH